MLNENDSICQIQYSLAKDLFKSPKHFHKLMNNMHEVVFQCSDDGKLQFLNQSWHRITGYSVAESLGHFLGDFLYKEDRNIILKLISGEENHYELRFLHRNGDTLWLELSICKGYGGNNIGLLYNITARKLIEERVKRDLEQFFAILDCLPGFVYLKNKDYYITYCNYKFKETFGDGLGKACYKLINDSEDRCNLCSSASVFETKVPRISEWIYHKNVQHYQIYDHPFIDIDGTELVLTLGIDITDHKILENTQKKLIKNLEKAVATIKTLKGLIPICASCKKVRDDKGFWNEVEQYIRLHSDVEFTHSICPECTKRLYPEINKGKALKRYVNKCFAIANLVTI